MSRTAPATDFKPLPLAIPPSATLSTMPKLPHGVSQLLTMLTYKRPSGSASERDFIARYITPTGAVSDEIGNWWLSIPMANGEPSPLLWSSHTDTVHKTPGTQLVQYGDHTATTTSGECLGADCTAGVWLMLAMIRANVPGTYVFHHAEEIGGIGSAYAAKHLQARFAHIRAAIALDRRGTADVITHQGWQRTCSDAFARSLCKALAPLKLSPDDGGTFTDTANYTDLVGECTNVSVGYYHAHRPEECLDVGYLRSLRDALLAADWSTIVFERKPRDSDPLDYVSGDWASHYKGANAPKKSIVTRRGGTMQDFVFDNPDVTADFLEACGFDLATLEDFANDWLAS